MNTPCKDCKFCKVGFFGWLFGNYEFSKCRHPSYHRTDRVTGKEFYLIEYCEHNRKKGRDCSKEGLLFEPKDSKALKYIDFVEERKAYKEAEKRMYADLKEAGAKIYKNIDSYLIPNGGGSGTITSLLKLYINGGTEPNVVRHRDERQALIETETRKECAAYIRGKYKGEKLIMTNPEKLAKEIEDLK